MLTTAPPLTPYHRLARTPATRWWRPIAGISFIVVCGLALAMLVGGIFYLIAAVRGRPIDADGLPVLGARAEFAVTFLVIAVFLPVTLLAARWFERRRPNTLSSVVGRLRLRWLCTVCLPLALAAVLVVLTAGLALGVPELVPTGPPAGPAAFATSMLVLLLVVPPQAAAEEYLTRGWLLQAAGAWCRSPWVPIALQALVFAALHGWGTPWGFASLLVFGGVAGWLTVRTGGLEAAIALHIMNNLVVTALGAAFNDLTVDQTAADMPWQLAVIEVPVLLGYAALVHRLSRRRGLATVTPEPEPERPAATLEPAR